MRTIKKMEYEFLVIVFDLSELNLDKFSLSWDTQVEEMSDGRMGSLRFPAISEGYDPKFDRAIIQGEFTDRDGIPVSFAVNIDQEDSLYELDLWKADFSPLKNLPTTPDEVRIILNT